MKSEAKTKAALLLENTRLRARLQESEEIIRKFRGGEGEALPPGKEVEHPKHAGGTLRDDHGVMSSVIPQVLDMTAHNRTVDALRRSEDQLLQTGRMAKVGGWDLDVETMTLSWSLETCHIHEVDPSFRPDLGSAINFYAPEARPLITEAVSRAIEDGLSFDLELPFITATGKHIWVRAMGQPEVRDDKCVRLAGAFQDITDRRKKEEELRQVNRTLRARNESIMALMSTTDETEYLGRVCRIVTENCGHAMVWIGFAENDGNKSIRPVAHAGFESGYLETLKLTWAETERGQGPTGTAIRTGKVSVCHNMLTDPRFAPWRAEALKRGYASSIALPLIEDNRPSGAITIYSREPDPFSEAEVQLLTDLANTLGFGIHTIRLRKAHTKIEEALRDSERRFRLALKNAPVSVAAQDKNLRFIWAYNQRTVNPTDIIGKTDADLFAPEDAARLAALKHEVLRTGKEKADNLWVTSNGVKRFVNVYLEPLRNQKGEIDGVGIATLDLTEREQAEDAILSAKQEWERTFDSVPDLIAVMDRNHRIVRANRAMASRLHVTPDQCIGRECYLSVHGTQAPPHFCPHTRTMSDGQEHTVEIHEPGLGGDFVVSTTPLRDGNGNLIGSVHVSRDVTGRKAAEDTIRNQYALLKSIIESPEAPVFSVDGSYRYTSFNKSHAGVMNTLYGAQIEVGGNILGYHSVDRDRAGAKASIDRVLQGEAFTIDAWVGTDEQSRKCFEISHSPVKDGRGNITGAAIFATDVTARKKARQQIEHLASFPRLNPSPVVELDINGTITFVNEAALKTAGELGADADIRILLPADIGEILDAVKKGKDSRTFSRDVTTADRTFTESIHASKELGVIRVYCTEITERRHAEEALRRSAEEYRSLMEEASDGILVTESTGQILAANARLCEMIGRGKEEFSALTLRDLMPDDDCARFCSSVEKGAARTEILEHHLKHKNGTMAQVQTSVRQLAGGRIQSIIRDITRQKDREQRLMHVMQEEVLEKLFLKLKAFKHGQSGAMNLNRLALFADNMAAIAKSITSGGPGKGSGLLDRFGIAVDEFSTTVAPELEHIASLMTIAELDAITSPGSNDIRANADVLLASIEHLRERIAHIMSLANHDQADAFVQTYPSVQDDILSTISKIRYTLKDVAVFIETNFTCLVSDIVRTTIHKFEASAWALSLHFEDDTPGCKAIVGSAELASVLSILIENSIEAFGKSTGAEPLTSLRMEIRTEVTGQTIRIAVEDNGPGVPDAIRDNLFRQGVSGNSPDRGFGLSYARKCITKYGGRISHDPSLKSGARFVIEIPKA